jgi:protein phosphatase methylesterase 1
MEEDLGELHISHHAYLISPSKSAPLFVMHHGAGSSGLSFAACAGDIRNSLPTAGILSLDARGHGSTTISRVDAQSNGSNDDQPEADLSLETLSRDVAFVIRETQKKMKWKELPDLVLVGHSLGGAVMTDVAKKAELGSKVLAYAVLDVVEGTAFRNSLKLLDIANTQLRIGNGCTPEHGNLSINSPLKISFISFWDRMAVCFHPARFLCNYSCHFSTSTRSRSIRNSMSACVSVPSLLHEDPNPSDPSKPWTWRTNLAATKPYWENWFIGLSKKFLEARGGKLLLLAGTDRLDKELIIGQMQGELLFVLVI